jgi:tight adherence protein B
MGFVAFALVLLVVSALTWFGALIAVRTARLELARRVTLATMARSAELRPARGRLPLTSWSASANAMLRNLFAFRVARRWGIRLGGFSLLGVAIAAAGAAWFVAGRGLHFSLWIAAPLALAAFFLAPHALLRREQNGVEQKFLMLFPDAIDMAIRMLRAGLPISVAIRSISNDAQSPIRDVFRALSGQLEIGIPLDEAFAAMGDQIGLADFRFFVVAISLQHATGGNLAATLDVLSDIMRRRRAMRLKAQATTGEVRISAIVLGVLPFFVAGALLILSPGYLAGLFTDPRGNAIVAAAVVGLLAGIISMRQLMRRVTRL